jgi:2-iminobutanoate/2-iminopropanoate deaminase
MIPDLEEERLMAKTVGPFSPWRRIGQTIATSGQIGLGEDGKVVEGGFGPELEQTLRNLNNVFADAGVTREQVIKVNVYLADIADWSALNGPYAEFFGSSLPARTAFATSALPLDARVEIEAWAIVDETR